MAAPDVHVTEGPIERVRDEPIDFRVIGDDIRGHHVVPIYALGVKVYETWVDEQGRKMGRWTWRYL